MQFIDLKAQYEVLKTEIDCRMNQVLQHGKYIGGPEVQELEKKLAAYLNVKHAVACGNGTDALHMLYMAYGIGQGDAVFCPDVTFIASVEPACMLGATPVFCDITEDTYNISVESLERQVSAVQKEGKYRPKAVTAVDFLGNPADYERIELLCKKYDMILIEDAAQGFGANYHQKQCGAYGNAAVTSFFPAKPLGCYGDGGAIFTNEDKVKDFLESIRMHGKGTDKYDNVRIGLNSRLDTIQAAILAVKLTALEGYELAARRDVAENYDRRLEEIVSYQQIPLGYASSYAQYSIILRNENERDALQKHLYSQNIPTMIYYKKPMHKQTVYRNNKSIYRKLAVSDWLSESILNLPMHPYMKAEDVERICRIISEF
ncbi:MAG: DegT/DnrJ/EryC1/StrS family aminotransferase, partial [Christensenellaceae bacterium]